jgi:Arc/MetJ-type ribon-helix-helix transcriptional regulator
MMSKEFGDIRIPQDLIKKIEMRVEEAGFTSVDEYVTFVMEEVIKEVEDEEPDEVFSEEDEVKVKERLRALGYLD